MNLKKMFVYQISAFVLISANVMLTWASDDTLPIPHSTISTAIGKGITKATFSCPTNRYPHGVLGDRIEAACLLLENENKVQFKVALPETQVFEDLNPRIADIDNDGRNDVVVVRSDNSVGAAIVVYSIVGKSVEELASTPAIGSSFRWLAPIDILDFNGDGLLDIAYVQTPHIGGT